MLCLSAQSNPQGVPKELLEAKKLELIQEKVVYICMVYRKSGLRLNRSLLKRPPRKQSAAKSRNVLRSATSIIFVRENAVNADEVVGGVIEAIMTMTDDHQDTQDHHPQDGVAHHLVVNIVVTIVAHHPDVTLILTFRTVEVGMIVDEMTADDVAHHQ